MEPLKNMFNEAFVKTLSKHLKKYSPESDIAGFGRNFQSRQWKDAELKERVRLIAKYLHDALPGNYEEQLEVLIPMSREYRPSYLPIFFPQFVESYGADHWKASMEALEIFTQSSSAEFAIRPFIIRDEKKTIKQMLQWSRSKNVHVRRLASEGSRPRLPWGQKISSFIKDPSPALPILENLKDDPELYVRKSVANHLNDISKDNPKIILNIAKNWSGKSVHTDWIIKHALRGLLKKGNEDAMEIIGLGHRSKVEVDNLLLEKNKIRIGDVLGFRMDIHLLEKKPHHTRIEYAIDYVRSSGKSSRKIFQLAQKELTPGKHTFKRTQRMQDFTTRKHYPGKHQLIILVNGKEKISKSFDLSA